MHKIKESLHESPVGHTYRINILLIFINIYTFLNKNLFCLQLLHWWARSESTGGIAPNFFQEGV